MSDPALAVQRAFVARLKAQVIDVRGRVHDRAPQDVAFPFLQIGEIQTLEDGAECIDGTEVSGTLHIWSRAVGSVEARAISATCREALHEWIPDLASDGFRCVDHMHRSTRVFRDPDGITTHGVSEFRLLIDPV